MKSRTLRTTVAAAVVTGLLGTTGCFGSFALTRQLYKFNRDIESRWAEEIVFLALAIFPAYSGAMFLDAVIFNAWDFWGNPNPIRSAGDARFEERSFDVGDERIVIAPLAGRSDGAVEVRRYRGDELVEASFVRVDRQGVGVKTNLEGHELARASLQPDGSVLVEAAATGERVRVAP